MMYSLILFNGYVRFYCKNVDCMFNENGLCKEKFTFFPRNLIKKFDGKKSIKCMYD